MFIQFQSAKFTYTLKNAKKIIIFHMARKKNFLSDAMRRAAGIMLQLMCIEYKAELKWLFCPVGVFSTRISGVSHLCMQYLLLDYLGIYLPASSCYFLTDVKGGFRNLGNFLTVCHKVYQSRAISSKFF